MAKAELPASYRATPISTGSPTPIRLWDRRTRLYRIPELAAELLNEAVAGARPPIPPMRRIEPGRLPIIGSRVALYSHFSHANRIDPMVHRQLALYRDLGFAIVFVTASPAIDPVDWDAVKEGVSLAIDRHNFARDFGAWKDAFPEVIRRWPALDTVLLVNDSVLGPLRPLEPILAAMDEAGAGVVGLTESHQGPPHLQSYFVQVSGARAVADLGAFFQALVLTQSRWLIVRRGEYGLSRFLQARGHRVSSLFPFPAVQAAALALGIARAGQGAINPTHHGWRLLVERLGFPFIKRDLLLRNPNRVAGIEKWRDLVPIEAPVPLALIEDHLSAY